MFFTRNAQAAPPSTPANPSNAEVIQTLRWWTDRSWKGRKLWSALNHGFTIVIVIFSTVASALSQTHSQIMHHAPFLSHLRNADLVTIFTALVVIFTAIQAKIGFEKKWIANRMTRSALDQLNVSYNSNLPIEEISMRLTKIIADHDRAITG